MADLLGKNLTYEGRRLVVPSEGGVFGRDPRNHLVITHESVSSLHGVFRLEDGALFLRDQQSTNGTRVNGRDITEVQLQDGDLVEIGDLKFLLTAPEFKGRDATPAPVAAPALAPVPPSSGPAAPLPAVPQHTAGFLETPALRNTLIGAVLLVAVVVALVSYFANLGPGP